MRGQGVLGLLEEGNPELLPSVGLVSEIESLRKTGNHSWLQLCLLTSDTWLKVVQVPLLLCPHVPPDLLAGPHVDVLVRFAGSKCVWCCYSGADRRGTSILR